MAMKLLLKFFVLAVLGSIAIGCTSQVVINDNKIIGPKSYELATPGHDWETRTDVDTYSYSGLRFNVDFLSKNKVKNQYMFASSVVWSTSMEKITRKKREMFTGEDTIIKYLCEDVQELAGIKPEQIKSIKTGEMFGHKATELEIDIPATVNLLHTYKEGKAKLFSFHPETVTG
jgi:hypothetical protein